MFRLGIISGLLSHFFHVVLARLFLLVPLLLLLLCPGLRFQPGDPGLPAALNPETAHQHPVLGAELLALGPQKQISRIYFFVCGKNLVLFVKLRLHSGKTCPTDMGVRMAKRNGL